MTLLLAMLCLTVACNHRGGSKAERVDLGCVSIETPDSWQHIAQPGKDSRAGYFLTTNGDTLLYDVGLYSDALTEKEPRIAPIDDRENMVSQGYDTSLYVFVQNPRDVDIDSYRRQNVTYLTVGGFNIKYVTPRKYQFGITGIHIDSVGTTSLGRLKFTLSGQQVDSTTVLQLKTAIGSIQPSQNCP